MTRKYKRDWFFAYLGSALIYAVAPAMILLAIWMDWRWLPTAVFTMIVGGLLGHLSSAIDARNVRNRVYEGETELD